MDARNRILIPLMANVVFLLWGVAGMVWATNWHLVFPDRSDCSTALVEAVRAEPGVTEVKTPEACRGFDRREHAEIVASIPWSALFPPKKSPSPAPQPTTPTVKPVKPSASPTKAKPSATPRRDDPIETPAPAPAQTSPKTTAPSPSPVVSVTPSEFPSEEVAVPSTFASDGAVG